MFPLWPSVHVLYMLWIQTATLPAGFPRAYRMQRGLLKGEIGCIHSWCSELFWIWNWTLELELGAHSTTPNISNQWLSVKTWVNLYSSWIYVLVLLRMCSDGTTLITFPTDFWCFYVNMGLCINSIQSSSPPSLCWWIVELMFLLVPRTNQQLRTVHTKGLGLWSWTLVFLLSTS